MAAVSLLGTQTVNTTSGTHSVTATPAVGDLIILVVANTGTTGVIAPTDTNSDGLGTYYLAATALKATSADTLQIWVRNALIGSASSTVFSQAPGTTTGGGVGVIKVTGMSLIGRGAVRQVAIQSNQAAATPAPVFSSAALTTNPVIGAVFNATSAATLTPRTSFTELFDVGYSTPTTGLEVMKRDSGETGTTMTWGSASASAFCSIAIELQANSRPTTALNTPSDTGTVATTTPTLNFTGTDADSNTLEYDLQVHTANTFGEDFADDFDDNSLSASYLDNGGSNSNEQNGRLEFYTSLASGYYFVTYNVSINLTGKQMIIEMADAGDQTLASIDYAVQVEKADLTGDDTCMMVVEAGTLICRTRTATVQSTDVTVAYNATTMRWFRIRESGGNIFMDTSPDRITWTNRRTVANPYSDITNLRITMFTGTFAAEVRSTTTAYDNLSFGVAPLLEKDSTVSTGFTAGHPFTSGSAKDYIIQSGDALTNATTYYWRTRSYDPTGSNKYGAWSTTRSFTVNTSSVAAPKILTLLGVG